MPLIPAPPMPMKCTAPSSRQRRAPASVQAATSAALIAHSRPPPLEHEVGQPLVGVGTPAARGVPGPSPASRAGSVSSGTSVLCDPGRRQLGVVDQQPAPGLDDRQRR